MVTALGDASRSDMTEPNFSDSDRAMLLYASKLTKAPATITEQDVQLLRDVGFDDLAIHDICCVTSYFAFVNRIADGLGVELEPGSV